MQAGCNSFPGRFCQCQTCSANAICCCLLLAQAGVTPDDLLLQATRAWNVAVRERPHEEELWLEFAAFQHSAAQQQQQRSR